ncbi:MAG: transglycosylase SLT domain-containing protein [Desulfitobacteriia bacterium]
MLIGLQIILNSVGFLTKQDFSAYAYYPYGLSKISGSETVSTPAYEGPVIAESIQAEPVKEQPVAVEPVEEIQIEGKALPASEENFSERLNKKLTSIARDYHAEPEYLNYIIKVEKTFDLLPCELLALIAQESGFKPQTRMDGGTLSYSTTQMKLPSARTAYMAITEYYGIEIPQPTSELLDKNKYYATFLAGGYLRYLNDVYKDRYESYTAYNRGIGGRLTFYKNHGHYKSAYALKVSTLSETFKNQLGSDYQWAKEIKVLNPEDRKF